MLTSRSIRNRQMASMGVRCPSWYTADVGLGDLLSMELVDDESAETVEAVVLDVDDHGYFRDVTYDAADRRGLARLFTDGPKEIGVVACRVIRRATRPTRPDPWDGTIVEADELEAGGGLPVCCPECNALIERVPRAGWPCWECRTKQETMR
jgi:hypothetical protein